MEPDSKHPLLFQLKPKPHDRRRLRTISLFLLTSILLLTLNYTSYLDSTKLSNLFNRLFRRPQHLATQKPDHEDYDKFVWHKNILSDWDPNSDHRLITFGDVHGMGHSLKELLKNLNHDPQADTVLIVGDLAAKHPNIQASLDTIRYCRESKFEAVRGNHDEYIIIWRNWMELNRAKFVEPDQVLGYNSDDHANLQSDLWLQASKPPQDLKKKLPNGMDWGTQHFEIARRLPKIDFHWLLERSLTIYVSPLRTYFVHAGMLPWVPPNEPEADMAREVMSLLGVKENKESYTLLEMRGLKKGRRPTKDANKGKPWYKYWNKTMRSCNQTSMTSSAARAWCERAQYVVYGHWAGKGLTVKPWSIGLDSGCVYGRQLSALVIGKPRASVTKKHKGLLKPIPTQISNYNATIFQVNCREP
ncbi:hypothetical protein PGT21_001350 [Puccinia graminis f. sp. tritici]|uniref:Calcineurin-like phosphoesterase domain-containing protein n=2 Tax=Puccinia graminis f. sp. tritici TaxID=56615 RepID=E3L2Y6_PUCGT|nr:uncharacterized protein PGTG_17183 [Puccinia graminis f. sp. tritici CRL 75-36-700-3]EFP90911.1 hypothetical protein PGTG_17183 [Puccinia graminis f. sp. tritici CRL 75-36-700-3]KAA1112540.1 hypothetical protein PGT21_001350 [Puccinia graminis f. sp. tritici]